VETANALYHRWQELMSENANVNKEDFNWTTNELRNCLRSIEWDLDDLEETVYILLVVFLSSFASKKLIRYVVVVWFG